MIQDFTELTEDLKNRGIYLGLHFMNNEASTSLRISRTTTEIKCQFVPPSNHRSENSEREIQTFKNHFILLLHSVDKYFHLKLRDRLLQHSTININLLRQSIICPAL